MSYWTDIAASVRAEAATQIESWIAPPEGSTVLAIGAHRGDVALHLARGGVRVLICDSSLSKLAPLQEPSQGGSDRVSTCLVRSGPPLRPSSPFHDAMFHAAIAIEEIDRLNPEDQLGYIEGLDEAPTDQLVVGVRVEVRGRSLIAGSLPPELQATVNSTDLLRNLHLTTSFRLQQREQICRRRLALELWHLKRY